MKSIAAVLSILLLSVSGWAMTPISDSELSDITGQSGVTIIIDVTMDIQFATIAWGDSDGCEINYHGTSADAAAGYYLLSSQKSKRPVKSGATGISNNDGNPIFMLSNSYSKPGLIAFEALGNGTFIPDDAFMLSYLRSLKMPQHVSIPWFSRW